MYYYVKFASNKYKEHKGFQINQWYYLKIDIPIKEYEEKYKGVIVTTKKPYL